MVAPTTPPPVSEERLRELVDHNETLREMLVTAGMGVDDIEERLSLCHELITARATIASLVINLNAMRKHGDSLGTTIAALTKELATVRRMHLQMCELAVARHGEIERITAEHDRRGTSIREYMDMCEEYSASVVELTDLLTRVRAERDAMRANDARYRWLRDSENVRVVLHCYNGDTETILEWPSQSAADAAIDACIARDAAMTPSPSQVPHE